MKGTGMTVATLTSKGQTTIPKQVREHLKLNPGDKLDFVIESEGRVVIRPAKLDVRELKGLLKRTDGKSWTLVTPLALVALIGVHLNWEIIKRSVLDVSPVDAETQSDRDEAKRSGE